MGRGREQAKPYAVWLCPALGAYVSRPRPHTHRVGVRSLLCGVHLWGYPPGARGWGRSGSGVGEWGRGVSRHPVGVSPEPSICRLQGRQAQGGPMLGTWLLQAPGYTPGGQGQGSPVGPLRGFPPPATGTHRRCTRRIHRSRWHTPGHRGPVGSPTGALLPCRSLAHPHPGPASGRP